MAYGKLKCDTLTFDNSGSDTDVTISSLNAKASLPASAGTVGASEVVQVDANKDITGFRHITLSGDLTVNGTTTTVNSTNTTITDNLLELNSGASSNANDSGIIIERGSTGDNAIIAWDESADKFVVGTTTATASSTGDITITAGTLVAGTVEDSKGDVRKIPQNNQTSAYTLVAADAGKHIRTTSNVTVPDSVFSVGDAITIFNNSGSDITITQGSGITLSNAADGTTGHRTLSTKGLATVLCHNGANEFVISGAGLS